MGSKDGDSRWDIDDWIEASRAEMNQIRKKVDDELNRHFPSTSHHDSSPDDRSASERFKSFIDSSLGTVFDGLKDFPNNISELRSRMQREWEARREEERDIWRRWTGSEDSPDHIRMQIDRSSKEERDEEEASARLLLHQSRKRNGKVPWSKMVALYQDGERTFGALDQFATPMLSFGGACYYKPETVDNLPSTARWGWPAPKQPWLSVEWFKRDPYSPVRLEAHRDLQERGPLWRAAFEDLMCAALDKPMESEEKVGMRVPHGTSQSTYYGPGLDWMLSLQCRGILPPQIPSLYSKDLGKQPWILAKLMASTELDSKSERLLGDASSDRGILRDFDRLVDEVGTRAIPDTEAAPLRLHMPVQQEPDSELDMYEVYEEATMADLDRSEPAGSADQGLQYESNQTSEYYSDSLHEQAAQQQMTRSQSAPRHESTSPDHVPQQKPEILSQLTMTETTRAPDGTVTTKVKLKQRFADGSERSREDVHTSYEQLPATTHVPEDNAANDSKTQASKKGWFWS